jgi:hypothetical protein
MTMSTKLHDGQPPERLSLFMFCKSSRSSDESTKSVGVLLNACNTKIVDVYFLKKIALIFVPGLVVNYSNRGCLDNMCNSLYTSIKLFYTDYET